MRNDTYHEPPPHFRPRDPSRRMLPVGQPRVVHRQSAAKHRRNGDAVWRVGVDLATGRALYRWIPGRPYGGAPREPHHDAYRDGERYHTD